MNLRMLFENRSGRVIATFRTVLALVFLLAVLFEPVSRPSSQLNGQVLIAGYLAVALAVMVATWRSWWLDQLLAPWLLVLDVVVFVAAVNLTESGDADFTSPFLAMFALAILSATLRWDWRVALRTGIAATTLFVMLGGLQLGLGLPFDVYRFGRRVLYMLALLLVLVWFGIERRDPHVPALDLPPDDSNSTAARRRALDYAMQITGARAGALAWSDAEEPWIDLHRRDGAAERVERLGPDAIARWDEATDEVRLFDLPRRRKLVRDADNLPRARTLQAPVTLAEHCGFDQGLALPLRCASGTGLIVLGRIAGAGADFVTLGAIVAREIATALDRGTVLQLEREALLSRTRGAIARDLHDSVAQSLAGACFRLEGLRRTLPLEPAAEAEVLAIRDALRSEQGHVRGLIENLRNPAPESALRDLADDLDVAAQVAAAHWRVAVALSARQAIAVPGWLSHELQQLLREAVANAARHGDATHITATLSQDGGAIRLSVSDNGCGFDTDVLTRHPWSIRERVGTLGGHLCVTSGPDGTRLEIELPPAIAGADA